SAIAAWEVVLHLERSTPRSCVGILSPRTHATIGPRSDGCSRLTKSGEQGGDDARHARCESGAHVRASNRGAARRDEGEITRSGRAVPRNGSLVRREQGSAA